VGAYGEYLDRQLDFQALTEERKKQLRRVSELRGGRDVLVFAADLNKPIPQTSIIYSDLLPIGDQLANLAGPSLDLILETPGGSGEVAEDVIRLLHERERDVAVIVPGWAKSAGTIIAMAGDEILMEPGSALGPIDAQIQWQGKVFSADALLEGMEKIKREVAETGALNRAYIPILQGISPGELQSAENALMFARQLVTDWLVRYKFKSWKEHGSTGLPVTAEEKRARAEAIAAQLCDHKRWLTHGRSIKLADLEGMRLRITDYSKQGELADAIRRYHTLLQMTFETNIYKVFETPTTQIYRFLVPQAQGPIGQVGQPPRVGDAKVADAAFLEIKCGKCGADAKIQANLGKTQLILAGCVPFPANNRYRCPGCGTEADLSDARRQIEAQAKRPVVT
jgi:hypothetical protein